MIRHILAAALIAIPAAVSASPDRFSVTIGSHHTDRSYDWSEVNPGVFLTWENVGPVDLSGGAFLNSFGGPSVAAVAALPLVEWISGEIAVFGGLAWYPGYGDEFLVHAGDIVPMGGLQIRQGIAFVQIAPGKIEPLEGIFAFGLTFPLN